MEKKVSVGSGWSDAWPSPISEQSWVGADGTAWRMRGGPIEERALRRLLRRPGTRLLHVYGTEPVELSISEASGLLDSLNQFYAGQAPPFSDFVVADFRNGDRDVLIVVEESC